MAKQLVPEKITREEINSAMEQFLQKGGKIKRIEKQVQFLEDFFEDSLSGEDNSLLNMNFTSQSF